jgi:hypothetical protein
MSTPAALLDALGYDRPPVEWRTTSVPPITPDRFGKDHYSTLLYVETRAVDYKGLLDHEHMRCNGLRHPIMLLSKARSIAFGTTQVDAREYPTWLAGGVEQADHDDYDCLDDLLAAGWLTVTMPRIEQAKADPTLPVFVDAAGHPVVTGGRSDRRGRPRTGELIDPRFVTGQDELWVCARAQWGLTDAGSDVTAALRKHKASGGSYATFTLPEALS